MDLANRYWKICIKDEMKLNNEIKGGRKMMAGYKTWLAVAGMVILGVVEILNGATETGITKIVAALALVGIGHKIEKQKQ